MANIALVWNSDEPRPVGALCSVRAGAAGLGRELAPDDDACALGLAPGEYMVGLAGGLALYGTKKTEVRREAQNLDLGEVHVREEVALAIDATSPAFIDGILRATETNAEVTLAFWLHCSRVWRSRRTGLRVLRSRRHCWMLGV